MRINDTLNYFSYYLFKKSLPQDIIIVGIDDYSLGNIPYKWPWKRSVYAEFLNILKEEGTKSVLFDLAFVGSSEEAEDKAFIEALRNFSGNILLAYYFDKSGNPIYPLDAFKELARIGFINTPEDDDGLIRRLRGNIKEDFSFSIESVSLYLKEEVKILPNGLEIGKRFIPLDKKRTYHINYLYKPKDLKYISFFDVLEKKFPEGEFKDKFVFVGPVAGIIHDIHLTPLGKMPGLYLHVNGFLNIIENRIVRNLNLEPLIYIFIFISIAIILKRFSFLRGVFLTSGILLFLFWMDIFFLSQGFRYNFGDIFIFSFLYLSLGNLYKYFYLLSLLLRIKNKAITDPLSGLFTQRYFYYLLDLELSKFYLKNLYLFCVLVDARKQEFSKLKETLREISNFLLQKKIKGALLNEGAIIGFFNCKKNIIGFLFELRDRIEEILSHRDIKGKIKIGYLKAKKGIIPKDFFLETFGRLNSSSDQILECSQIIRTPLTHEVSRDTLEFLKKDIEERNIELVNLIEKLKEEEEKKEKAYFELIVSLVLAIEERDPYTQGHSERVANLCLALAERLNLSLEEKEKLRRAALLHDIGKIGIPDKILHKKGALTEEEFDIVKKHCSLGIKVLEPITELRDLIPYILHHHEHYDGSGYPYGLSKGSIPLGARIICICDVYDALTTGRDYKRALSDEEAIQTLDKGKFRQFDPELLDIFKEIILNKGQ